MSDENDNSAQPLWHGRFAEGRCRVVGVHAQPAVRPAPRPLRHSWLSCPRGGARCRRHPDADEVASVEAALDTTEAELASGEFVYVDTDEDIHTAIERRVTEIAGDAGARLHTGRSRNDQVATAFRLFCKDAVATVAERVVSLQAVLVARADEADKAYLPGYTHLQQAQPVLLRHHLLAHFWALSRDLDRLVDAHRRLDVSPLGAGALAGSSLPIDPVANAERLGFASAFANSLDAVSDRDFVAEILFDFTMIAIHLSRIGEEIVIWSTEEFGFVRLSDAYSTGSSMLPQKKNPDIAELARGKAGRAIGNLTGPARDAEGSPVGVQPRSAGGQGTVVRHLRPGASWPRGGRRHARHGHLQHRSDGGVGPTARMPPPPTSPSTSCGAACHSATRTRWSGRSFDARWTKASSSRRSSRPNRRLGPEAAALMRPGVPVQMRTTAGGAGPGPVATQLVAARERLAADCERTGALTR